MCGRSAVYGEGAAGTLTGQLLRAGQCYRQRRTTCRRTVHRAAPLEPTGCRHRRPSRRGDDTVRIVRARPAWGRVAAAWGAVVVSTLLMNFVVVTPLATYYAQRYAQAFVIRAEGWSPRCSSATRSSSTGLLIVIEPPGDTTSSYLHTLSSRSVTSSSALSAFLTTWL